MSEIKTTKEHFKIFKTEVKKWMDYFGLKSWKIDFKHIETDNANATVLFKENSGIARFTLAINWEAEEGKDIEICVRQTAFHEVVHLLLGKIDAIAISRFTTEEELNKELHAVIRIMENTIFKDLKI